MLEIGVRQFYSFLPRVSPLPPVNFKSRSAARENRCSSVSSGGPFRADRHGRRPRTKEEGAAQHADLWDQISGRAPPEKERLTAGQLERLKT